MGFRAGVHKSESAKEMLLSQHMFGPLPSPPSSSADVSIFNLIYFLFKNAILLIMMIFTKEIDGFPPLPPLPTESNADVYDNKISYLDGHSYRSTSLGKSKYESRYRDSLENAPPIPPHRCPSAENTLRTM